MTPARLLLALFLLLPASISACSDPNCIDAEDRAEAVASAQRHVDGMREAELSIRALTDARSAQGRARLREAAKLRESAERMLKLTTEMMDKSQPGCS